MALKKWFLLFGVAAIIIGCGGGGGNGGTTTTTSTTTTTTGGMSVNIPNVPGTLSLTYNSGAGRDIPPATAFVNKVIFEDGTPNPPQTELQPEVAIKLDAFNSQEITVPIPNTQPGSRHFTVLTVEFDRIEFSGGGGGVPPVEVFPDTTKDGPGSPSMSARVFPGRRTTVPLYISNLMFNTGPLALDRNVFSLFNLPFGTNQFRGVVSDFITFDIRQVTNRPALPDGTPADAVNFTGDLAAISAGGMSVGSTDGQLSFLGVPDFVGGNFAGPASLPGPGGGSSAVPGTYFARQANPNDTPGVTLPPIIAMTGIWRHYSDLLNNVGSFGFLTIPTGADNDVHVAVLFARDGQGRITELFWGDPRIDATTGADLNAGTFRVYPVSDITGALNPARSLSGTFSAIQRVQNVARTGNFSITNGTVPAGFSSSGQFLVFRR